jgi:3'-5' exoribonuclease
MLLHHLDNLDSKMECIRALAEKDRHIEGCWTGYSSALQRSILKKEKYLEDAPAREVPAAPSATHEPSAPPVSVEALRPEQQQPAVEHHAQRFAPSSSPFAEKLQQAWRKDP